MKLQSLTAKNFMPYKDEMKLVFPQDEQRNVMIIFGDNMRGKTSLMNALRWAFYGEALGRHSKLIPLREIVNKDGALMDNWRVDVAVKFEANSHQYELRRTVDRKPMVVTPSKTEDFRSDIFLWKDGAIVNGDQVDKEIALIAPKQTSRFFLFDGELLQEYETLLIENDQQGQQIKEAIEQVLGVPALINGRDDIQTILKQAQKRQSSDLKQVQGLEKQAARNDELITQRDALDKDIVNLIARLKTMNTERRALDDELEAQQNVIGFGEKLKVKSENQKTWIDECARKEKERLDLISGAWKDMIDKLLQTRRDQLENKRRTLFAASKQRNAIEVRIADLKKLLSIQECPTCGHKPGNDERAKHGQALGEAEAQLRRIENTDDELQEIMAQLGALSEIRGTNAKERLQQVEKDIDHYQVQLTRVESEIATLNDEIAGYDTADLARKRVMRDEKLVEERRLQDSIKKQKDELQKVNEEIAITQKAIEGSTKNRTQRSTIKVTVCNDLERIFSQSIEQLRDKLRSQVEALANGAFKHMTTQKNYRGLEINRNYGLQIIDASGRHVTVRSAGAEQIVALSLIDGLNRTGRSAGPVIMDTPFGRLDLKHRDNILRYLPSVTSQFVLLVHSGEIRRETDLTVIADRIGAQYEIKEVSTTQSRLERVEA